MSDIAPRPADASPARWKPICALDRRVLGVLVEKAKTTPDTYPMSVNALRSGCNQKNNRFPLMDVEIEDVEESLERLRAAGAVAEVQGGGRVPRYRHYMYEWLGVDKLELAVMTELLLRGAQTEGELRGRAARMDPIPDLGTLRPVLASLLEKGLVLSLTPEGRGHVVTHALYEPRELEKVRAEANAGAHAPSAAEPAAPPRPVTSQPATPQPAAAQHAPTSQHATTQQHSSVATAHAVSSTPARDDSSRAEIAELRRELEEVRDQVAQLRKDLDDLWSNFR